MTTLPEKIVELLAKSPGMTDREITSELRNASAPQQPVNNAANNLARRGAVVCRKRHDGLIGNYLTGQSIPVSQPVPEKASANLENELSEDSAKEILRVWLGSAGTEIAWGRMQGIDIDARRKSARWIIEVKGIGSRPQMNRAEFTEAPTLENWSMRIFPRG